MALFERYLRTQGFDLRLAAKAMEAEKCGTREELDARLEKQKWDIARFHFQNNNLYRKMVGGNFPQRWEELPVMVKTDYQHDLATMVSDGVSLARVYRANTSGSSGHPFSFAKNKDAHARSWALIAQRYAWHGLTLSSLQARFYGIPLERVQYAKEKIKDVIMRRVRFPVFDLSDQVLEKFEKRFTSRRFEYIYGYTNSLVLFARYVVRRGIVLKTICPSLRVCITTSEVCTPEDRAILERAFGIPVVNEYGASEVGIIAFESASGEWIISEENLLVEVVDDNGIPVADGNSGALLVTDLWNTTMPFIRYKIGDVGSISSSQHDPPAYRKRLVRLEGRVNDTILLPSGKRSPGLTFYYISRSILESSGVLREFIIRQTGLNHFVFDVVSDRALTGAEESEIHAKMDLYLEPGLELEIHRVPSIERPASGKIKHFYSEL